LDKGSIAHSFLSIRLDAFNAGQTIQHKRFVLVSALRPGEGTRAFSMAPPLLTG
jgi:hypothetical protein